MNRLTHRAPIAAVLRLALFAALLAGVLPADGAEKTKRLDAIWTHPQIAGFNVQSIAMLPPASFDRNLQAEKLADQMWGAAVRGTGYRWLGSGATKALLASRPGGDSLLKVVTERLLAVPRVDSLSAPALCQRLRADAVLTLRIDRWEKLEMEFNQAGKPSTTIQLRAALVDSTGALLWTAAGSETAEGPYHDPTANVMGVKSSGLTNQPVTGQGGAPAFEEVLTTLLGRWGPAFPPKAATPATTAGSTPPSAGSTPAAADTSRH